MLNLNGDESTPVSETALLKFEEIVYMESSQSSSTDPKVEPPKGPKGDVSMS
jgi:hypothetical protein